MTRGTVDGLCWVVETINRTTLPRYQWFYPWRITGRIVDVGVDRGRFTWHVPDLDDAAYVPAPGVVIPDEARTPNPYTPRRRSP